MRRITDSQPTPEVANPVSQGDRLFLIWLHQRLQQHGEPFHIDYMGKLRSIIAQTSPDKYTPNTAPNIEELEP